MIDFFRNLIFRDFWLKLLSFIFAVLIWRTVSEVFLRNDHSPSLSSSLSTFGSHTVERTYVNIPLLVIFPAADVRTLEVNPTEVQVTIQGEAKALQNFDPQNIHAQVNLRDIESARNLRKRIEVVVPAGFVYTRVIPDEVEVVIPPKK